MLAKGGIFDLIILDIMLPEMSGFDVISKLVHNEPKGTKVIIRL